MEDAIMLDPAILRWVLLPILIVMFMQGILRQFVSELLASPKTPSLEEIRRTQLLIRSQRLRANAQFISPAAFRMRKAYLTQKALPNAQRALQESSNTNTAAAPNSTTGNTAVVAAPQQTQDPMAGSGGMGDPMFMMNMMKQQMSFIVPQMLTMGWVGYFFTGFIPVKLPFPLTDRFKSMLQRGISLSSLDPSYVTALSWYFLVLFGLRGVFSLVLGANNDSDETKLMQAQMQGGMATGAPGASQELIKVIDAEKVEVEILQHNFVVPRAELRMSSALKK